MKKKILASLLSLCMIVSLFPATAMAEDIQCECGETHVETCVNYDAQQAEKSVETPAETPAEETEETPAETPAEKAEETPAETPVEKAEEAPAEEVVEETRKLNGEGTAQSPYIINNLEDFEWFRNDVNNGNNYSKKFVKLADNIDLASKEWTPIGNSKNQFQGTFDGDNKTISNLVVSGKKNDVGLFGFTANGEIKNLTVNNAKVSGRLDVGVVVGTPYTSKYSNIKVTGHIEVSGMSYVGGVGGKNAYASWNNITVDADSSSYVKANSIENGTAYRTYVGGVVGFMGEGNHSFTNISSNINVEGNVQDVGGIVGIAHYGNKFSNVTCSGTVTNTNTNAEENAETGGIAGTWMNTNSGKIELSSCTFTGKVLAGGVDVTKTNDIVGEKYYPNSNNGSLTIDGEVVLPKIAEANGQLYTSLQEAVNAANGGTVKLLKNANGNGVVIKTPVTIDFGGFTYKMNGTSVGSTGTETQCFQILKESGNVTLKNGKIVADMPKAAMVIQNYANLTVTDMDLVGKEGVTQYVMSNNCGTVNINGKTNITAPSKAVAFDVYDWRSGGYTGVEVIVDTTGTITGKIEVGGDGAGSAPKLTINNANIVSDTDGIVAKKGEVIINKANIKAGIKNDSSWDAIWADGGKVIIKDGTFHTGKDAKGDGNDTIYTKNGGTVDIYGGTFSTEAICSSYEPDQYSVLNENDANRNTIKVYGGTFVKFDPANNSSEGKGTNFVQSGYETKANGENFIVGEHRLVDVAEKPATCVAAGTKAHQKCDFCGRMYVNGKEVTAEELAIAATGVHAFGGWTVTKQPGCVSGGVETRYCGCGATETRPTGAKGHSFGADGKCSCGAYDASKDTTKPVTPVTPTKPQATSKPTPTPAETAKPTPQAPTSADTTITDVVANQEVVDAVKDNVTVTEGTAAVDKTTVDAVIDATKEETTIVLPLGSATDDVVNKAEISTDALEAAAETEKDVVIELTDVTIKLDARALRFIAEHAEGDEIEIRAVKSSVESLTETQQAALEDKEDVLIVTAQIFSDGKYIGEFSEGTATIKLPFKPAENKLAEDYKVYVIDESGNLSEIPAEYVDGYMVFTTANVADYAIVYEGEAVSGEVQTPEEPAQAEGGFPIIPIVVIIAIIIIGSIIFIIKKKNSDDE